MAKERPEAKLTDILQTSIVTSCKESWIYKLPDIPVTRPGRTPDNPVTRFTLARPFDLIGVIGGHGVAIEVKYHGKHTAFPFNRVEDHQITCLQDVHNAGGYASILIGIAFEMTDKIADKVPVELTRNISGNVWACIDLSLPQWKELEKDAMAKGRASFTLQELCDSGAIIPTTKKVKDGFNLFDFSYLSALSGWR